MNIQFFFSYFYVSDKNNKDIIVMPVVVSEELEKLQNEGDKNAKHAMEYWKDQIFKKMSI